MPRCFCYYCQIKCKQNDLNPHGLAEGNLSETKLQNQDVIASERSVFILYWEIYIQWKQLSKYLIVVYLLLIGLL